MRSSILEKCFIDGYMIEATGDSEDVNDVSSVYECRQQCQSSSSCVAATYTKSSKICTLYANP